MREILKPGWVLTVSEGEYHAAARRGDYLSSHLLGDFRANPRLYKGKMDGEIAQSETEAMLFGRMVHKLILEGRAEFDKEYIIDDGPRNPKTGEAYGKATKAYQEWARAMVLPVCSTKDFAFISALERSVRSHDVAGELLWSGFAEGVARATWCGEPCQIRMDWYDPERKALCDLKTCDTLDYFERDAVKFGYIYQMAFYRDVANAAAADVGGGAGGSDNKPTTASGGGSAGGSDNKPTTASGSGETGGDNKPTTASLGDGVVSDVYLIAVEKREPFRTGVWRISEEALETASERNRNAVGLLQDCRAMDQWPTGFEDIRELGFYRAKDGAEQNKEVEA